MMAAVLFLSPHSDNLAKQLQWASIGRAVTKKCLSCYREELHPTTVTTTLESIVDTLHYTRHVLTTMAISAVQNYSSSLEPL